eukprot:3467144-Karenia_brevis.AAC.1
MYCLQEKLVLTAVVWCRDSSPLACFTMLFIPSTRLRSKTPPPRNAPSPVVGEELEPEEANGKNARRVCLVTLPHPKQAMAAGCIPLVPPGSMSRRQILECFLDACAKPVYRDARSIQAAQPIPVSQTGVFR